jgi:hypothetical protein
MSSVTVQVIEDGGVQVVEVLVPGPPGAPGPAGDPGPAGVGAEWVQGAGAPEAGDGNDGDFYLDTLTGDIYGPKAAGAWGASIYNIAEGQEGPAGPAGADGADGDSAYEVAVAAGFVGNEAAWLASLVGEQGEQGPQGPAGADSVVPGPDGPAGPAGADGADGADGRTILSGVNAPTGGVGEDGDFFINTVTSEIYGPKFSGAWGSPTSLIGAAGATGNTGAAGLDGKTILSGTGVPSNGLGVDGDFYIATDTSTIYGPKAAGVWPAGVSLIGPQGAAGDTGPAGTTDYNDLSNKPALDFIPSADAPTGDIVGTTDAQTLTNKTLGDLKETVFTVSDGASVDLDPANGPIQQWTLGANRTPTATNFAAGESMLLMVADGTAFAVTWTTMAVVWVGGTAPTLATSGWTVIELWRVGSTTYGARVGDVA